MANSQSQAVQLKDAYIKGVKDAVGSEAIAAAGQSELAGLAGKLGMEVADTASITMDPTGNRKVFVDDGDASMYILNERGDKKRQYMDRADLEALGQELGAPDYAEYAANPISHARDVWKQPLTADDRKFSSAGARNKAYLGLQEARLLGRPVVDAKLEDMR